MRARRWALTFLLLALFVGVWQLVASLPGVDRLILASPAETARALGNDRSLLLDNAWTTLAEALLGLAIAVAFGALAAVGMHLVRPLRDAAYPLLVASQAIPIFVLAPLFVLAFDYGIGPKLALVEEPRTLVLVTHDVEEALYLADRVAVMSPRPGRIVAQLDVPFARPRTRRREIVTSPEFAELRERAMEALGQ